MEIKGCIFDLDGVIVDTAHYHLIAWNEIANKFGYNLNEEDNSRLKGVARMESLDLILQLAKVDKSDTERMELATIKNDRYVEMISSIDETSLLPGVYDLLENLQRHGIKIALGSASKNARKIIEKTRLSSFFDAIVDGTNVKHSKPDPEVFLKGAMAINLSPENIIVFEDSVKGLEAAISGGFRTVGIGDVIELNIADHVIANLSNQSLNSLNHLFSSKA